MSYSLRDVLRLTKVETESDQFAPYLLKCIFELVQEMVELCSVSKVNLNGISAFELKTNDWQIALI